MYETRLKIEKRNFPVEFMIPRKTEENVNESYNTIHTDGRSATPTGSCVVLV